MCIPGKDLLSRLLRNKYMDIDRITMPIIRLVVFTLSRVAVLDSCEEDILMTV